MIYEDGVFSKYLWLAASASFTFCFVALLLECVCGCRKKIPKNELLGLAGMVKITNPDENVNFNSSLPNVEINSVTVSLENLDGESPDQNKRGSVAATATRSLPDLPVDSAEGGEKAWVPGETNADANSGFYATVEDSNSREKKRNNLTRGPTGDSSQTDDSYSLYARLKGEHPYDQLQQNEHQYAQVGTNGTALPSTSQDTTVNSTPSRRFEPERESRSKSPSLSEPIDDIPAASAIAGSVPANHDLPYMTPPIPNQHFSGDSQDSCKGYTSISVREPLARIMGVRRNDSSHYATVSDDSDEMYAAIEERNTGEYTSGSETYAQIAPVLQIVPVQQHTRQESSSSACSSVVSPGSPKKEKRQANSPLPSPPTPTLDDMYAKVIKKQRSTPETESLTEEPSPPPPSTSSNVESNHSRVSCGEGEGGYESVERPPSDSDPNYEELPQTEPDYASLSRRYEPNYENVSSSDPNYESVEEGEARGEEPPYERLDNSLLLPDYETLYSHDGEPLSLVQDLYAQINKSPEKS